MISLHVSPLANHLWQSTLFAGLAVLLAVALRRNRAQLRYRLWLAASFKFFIPFSLLVTAGSQFAWRTAPAVAPPLSSAIEQISQPFTPSALALPVASAPAAPTMRVLPILLVGLWFAGVAVVLGQWWTRWRRVRLALRSASPLPIGGPIPVMTSPTRLEPGVFGVFRPVLLLPEGIADRLTPVQLQAILAHEFCHVRRRDNLASAVHMLVQAAFWFHPLVWWIGARLVEERERACDEQVLCEGSDPKAYAEGILYVCKWYVQSPLECASGVTGADLKKRIEAIMTQRVHPALTPLRKVLITAAGLAAIVVPVAIGVVNAPRIRAQSQGESTLKFEVASIKPTRPGSGGGKGGMQVLPGGGLRMSGVSLSSLIALAYDIRETQISGGPRWMNSDMYDLLAKPEHPAPADNAAVVAPGTTAWDRMRLRLQSLLTERFDLAFHKTSKDTSVYELTVARGGPKLQESKPEDEGNVRAMRGRGQIDLHKATMHMLSQVLTGLMGRPVVDKTGLTGTYDGKLEYLQEEGPGAGGIPGEPPAGVADASRPSVFTALQEQFGLKLDSAKGSIETIVIDRASKPSAN